MGLAYVPLDFDLRQFSPLFVRTFEKGWAKFICQDLEGLRCIWYPLPVSLIFLFIFLCTFFVLLFPKGPGKIVMYFIPFSSSLTKDPLQFFITCVIRVLWLFRPFRRTSLVLIPWHAKSWKDCGAFDSHFQLPWPKILLMGDALPKLFLYPLSCRKWTLGGGFKKQFQSLNRWHC